MVATSCCPLSVALSTQRQGPFERTRRQDLGHHSVGHLDESGLVERDRPAQCCRLDLRRFRDGVDRRILLVSVPLGRDGHNDVAWIIYGTTLEPFPAGLIGGFGSAGIAPVGDEFLAKLGADLSLPGLIGTHQALSTSSSRAAIPSR